MLKGVWAYKVVLRMVYITHKALALNVLNGAARELSSLHNVMMERI